MILLSKYLTGLKIATTIIRIYLIFWMIALLISTFNPFGLYKVSIMTYLILILGVIAFYLGFMSLKIKIRNDRILSIEESVLKSSLFKIILVACFVIILYYGLKYASIYLVMGSGARATRFGTGELFSSTSILFVYSLFISTFSISCIYIFSYILVFSRKKGIVFLLSFFIIIISAYIGGGRAGFFSIILAIALFSFIKKSLLKSPIKIEYIFRNKMKKNNMLILFIIIAILFILSVLVTVMRMSENASFFDGLYLLSEQLIVYMVGPFRAFDYGISQYAPTLGYLYGAGTFAGIGEFIFFLMHLIGVNVYYANSIIGNLLGLYIDIGGGHIFNYAFTNNMIFYFDFGIIGVILFSFLFGIFVRYIINLFIKKTNIYTLILLGYIFEAMMYSLFSWKLQSLPAIFLILVCLFLNSEIRLSKQRKKIKFSLKIIDIRR